MEGENLSLGDIYCCCKLTNDISWKKTRTIKNCGNPQWNEIIQLQRTNSSNELEIQVKNENIFNYILLDKKIKTLKDTKYGTIVIK